MDKIWPLLILTVGGLFLFGRNSISNVLSKMVVSFKTARPDLINARIGLIFNFYNPLPISISLDKIIGNVTINGKVISDFYNTEPQQIEPGNNLITIYTNPSPAGVNNLLNQLTVGKIVSNYTLISGPINYSDSAPLM